MTLRAEGAFTIRSSIIAVAMVILFCAVIAPAPAAEVMPPKPARYFNDYASVVSSETANRLNQKLVEFEQQTTNQIVVAVFPKMQSDSSIEDYTVRIANQWKVGQKDRRNGVVLFVFVQDHTMRIEVGYGLEGALPDITAKQIMDDEIRPRFRSGDYAGGLESGINAIIAATKGEYKARPRKQAPFWLPWIPIIVMALLWIWYERFRRRNRGKYGWLPDVGPGFILSSRGGSWGGGSWGGGGGSWGGGGGFSGGGGSFGGGGASGSW